MVVVDAQRNTMHYFVKYGICHNRARVRMAQWENSKNNNNKLMEKKRKMRNISLYNRIKNNKNCVVFRSMSITAVFSMFSALSMVYRVNDDDNEQCHTDYIDGVQCALCMYLYVSVFVTRNSIFPT